MGGGRDASDSLHQLGRKRRREDDDGGIYRLYSPEKQGNLYLLTPSHPELPPRKLFPLSKLARILSDDDDDDDDDDAFFHDEPVPHTHRPRQPPPQHRPLQGQNQGRPTPGGEMPVLLAPCHICHRRPTKKSDVDSFAVCQGCSLQTCFVCIRECQSVPLLSDRDLFVPPFSTTMTDADVPPNQQRPPPPRRLVDSTLDEPCRKKTSDGGMGWDAHGHRSVVCSRCCVEKGLLGEVVCLGCLSGAATST
ncbi:hypothetical protein RJ55_02317 [Drechmeria coniospora]|nr:hypothetical protein RJ55_02317 [Drechmeria coniospora]